MSLQITMRMIDDKTNTVVREATKTVVAKWVADDTVDVSELEPLTGKGAREEIVDAAVIALTAAVTELLTEVVVG